MNLKSKKIYLIIVFFSILLTINFVSGEMIGDLEVLNRSSQSNNYLNTTSNETVIEIYGGDVNIKNLTNDYRPYNEITNFTENETSLALTWNNKSVIFRFFTINESGYKDYFDEKSPEQLSVLDLSTTIISGLASYNYHHNMTSNLALQPAKFGYDLITNNVSCYRVHKWLICDEQKIDFSEAIDIQNLTVNLTDNSIEFSGSDLSFIDPQITLDHFDVWNSWGVWDNIGGCQPPDYDEDPENGGNDRLEAGVNDKTCDQEVHRAYIAFNLNDISPSWTINSVSFQYYADTIDDSWSGSSCDNLHFQELIYTDVNDWSPNNNAESDALWNAIDNHNVYYSDTSVDENLYNTAPFSSQAVSRLIVDKFNNYPFFVGFRHDVTSANDDCYIDIYNEDGPSPPRLLVNYVVPDTTPPTTSASATSPAGGSSYIFGSPTGDDVQISLSCADTGGNPGPSGCFVTKYCIDSSNSCSPASTYSSPLNINSEGTSYLRFFSTDNANNVESVQSRTILIERNYPVNVSVKIGQEEVFFYEGVFQSEEETGDFVQELNGFLSTCTADSEGYCTIPIDISSEHSGKINITDIEVYYEIDNYIWNVSDLAELSTYRTRVISTDGYFNSSYGSSANDFSISSLVVPNDINKFLIQNSSNQTVSWLGDLGNIVLSGSCFVSSNCIPPSGSLVISNSTDNSTAYLDPSGNLCLESGNCSNMQSSCNPATDSFIIQNTTGHNMSYLSFNGDLCYTGGLYQNATI